jgi:glycine cleavage system H lipoate-binding protein
MLTGLFVIIVVAALVLHYFLRERPAQRGADFGLPLPQPITLAEAVEGLPREVSLQPTFTWTRVRDNGEIFLGVHPMLTSLVGTDYSLELLADDTGIRRGSPILSLRQGQRELRIFSPVQGQIVEGNTEFTPLPDWRGHTLRGGSWVYRIQPDSLEAERRHWLEAEEASAWAARQYGKVRDFLFQTEAHLEVGLTAADGGELPTGILSQMDDPVWKSFQESFLPPPEEAEKE